jgi:hypothetical protein
MHEHHSSAIGVRRWWHVHKSHAQIFSKVTDLMKLHRMRIAVAFECDAERGGAARGMKRHSVKSG